MCHRKSPYVYKTPYAITNNDGTYIDALNTLGTLIVLSPKARLNLKYLPGVTNVTYLFDQPTLVPLDGRSWFLAFTKPHLEVTILLFCLLYTFNQISDSHEQE